MTLKERWKNQGMTRLMILWPVLFIAPALIEVPKSGFMLNFKFYLFTVALCWTVSLIGFLIFHFVMRRCNADR